MTPGGSSFSHRDRLGALLLCLALLTALTDVTAHTLMVALSGCGPVCGSGNGEIKSPGVHSYNMAQALTQSTFLSPNVCSRCHPLLLMTEPGFMSFSLGMRIIQYLDIRPQPWLSLFGNAVRNIFVIEFMF